jgi:hypothetical protein
MANYLLDSKIITQINDWGSVEWSSHFSYTLNENGLPTEKTVNTTITETGASTTILTDNFRYSWEIVSDVI